MSSRGRNDDNPVEAKNNTQIRISANAIAPDTDLTLKNWRSWKVKYLSCAEVLGLPEEFLQGGARPPTATDHDIMIARSILIKSMSEELIYLVEDCRNDLQECWKTLSQYFETDSRLARRQRKNQFYALTMERGQQFSKYAHELRHLQRKINASYGQDSPSRISEDDLVEALLQGVSKEHDTIFGATIAIIDSEVNVPSYDDVVKRLRPVAATAGLEFDPESKKEEAHPAADSHQWVRTNVRDPHLLPCYQLMDSGKCNYGDKCRFSHDAKLIAHHQNLRKVPSSFANKRPSHSSRRRPL